MSFFYFSLEVELETRDIWPDGDAPDNPTAADVAALMRSCGSMSTVLSDWNMLMDGGEVDGVVVWE